MSSNARKPTTYQDPARLPQIHVRGWSFLSRRAGPAALLLLGLTLSITGVALATSVASDFSQCSNFNPTYGNCVWIGSIVQSNNSLYAEGMSVPQRLMFDTIPSGNTHIITFSYEYTKGGVHGYDFITSWPQAVASALDVATMTLTLNQCADVPASMLTECNDLHSSGFFVDVDIPDDTFVSKDGATNTRIADYETTYGNRTMRLYSQTAFSGTPIVTLAHDPSTAGSDTGDSSVGVTLTYTTTTVSNAVLLEFAGHLAVSGSDPVAWGAGLGSSFITGGPFHFKIDKSFDGDGGSQDNQIQQLLNPTDVTLTNFSAHNNWGWLSLALVLGGVFIVASMGVVLVRRR